MLRKLFGRSVRRSPETEEEALGKLMEQPMSAHELSKLYPIIVPIECMELEWPGPIEQIGELPLALAWAVVCEPNRWLYVSLKQAAFWDEAGINWKEMAFQNLRRLADEGGFGFKEDDDGRPFIRIMLQEDAMGPSRLLVPHLFDDELGTDYVVALPERTCAIAYRADVDGQQLSDVNGMIGGCFEHGTEPVSPARYRASEFWGPAATYLR